MKFEIKSRRLVLVAALYFGAVLNLSLWRYLYRNLEITDPSGLIFALNLPLVLLAALTVIFSLLIWPYLARPALILLLLLSSAANYTMFQYGIFIDADMIRNIVQTNQREARDLVTAGGLIWLAFFGLLPALLVARLKIVYQPPWRETGGRLLIVAVCLAILGGSTVFFYKDYAFFGRNHKEMTRLINPANYLYATVRFFQLEALARREIVKIDEHARLAPYPDAGLTVFIMVVGETARSMNFSLNGYGRETNPELAREDLISFTDVTASGTATAIALPTMFSSQGRRDFNLTDIKYSENLLDLLQRAGYRVWWRENDDGCKGVCDRVPAEDMVKQGSEKYCDGSYCYDQVLIEGLEEHLKTLTQDTFIVLHTMGSHGPTYYKRYPAEFRRFTPTCDTGEVQTCDREAIVNTYDNTIVYTDHIVAQAIDILKKFPQYESGLLYVSDHGESLGENGVYLHGLPYSLAPAEQVKVPMVLWMSDHMKRSDHVDYECLRARKDRPLAHDNIFHSLLGLMEVRSTTYDQSLDLFQPCRTKPLP